MKEKLIDGLVIIERRGQKKAELRVLENAKEKRTQTDFSPDTILLKLTQNDLEYTLHFFLKYYRDGIAEVDHIDLQAISVNSRNEDSYVTLKVPDASPPLTPDELKKRLEMG